MTEDLNSIRTTIRRDMEALSNLDVPSLSAHDCESLAASSTPFPDLPPPMPPFVEQPWHASVTPALRCQVINRIGSFMFSRMSNEIGPVLYRRCLSGSRFIEAYMLSRSDSIDEYKQPPLLSLLQMDQENGVDGLMNALTNMNIH
ncbi:hypothetical protein M3Y99_01362200 [Aphelenchoides fujianensis]|nr:hypothetical protein M3Y99_01362200 [Aphelenchoides fujianensis]